VLRVDIGDCLWVAAPQKKRDCHRFSHECDESIGVGTIDLLCEIAKQSAYARVCNGLKLCDGVLCLLTCVTAPFCVMTNLLA